MKKLLINLVLFSSVISFGTGQDEASSGGKESEYVELLSHSNEALQPASDVTQTPKLSQGTDELLGRIIIHEELVTQYERVASIHQTSADQLRSEANKNYALARQYIYEAEQHEQQTQSFLANIKTTEVGLAGLILCALGFVPLLNFLHIPGLLALGYDFYPKLDNLWNAAKEIENQKHKKTQAEYFIKIGQDLQAQANSQAANAERVRGKMRDEQIQVANLRGEIRDMEIGRLQEELSTAKLALAEPVSALGTHS